MLLTSLIDSDDTEFLFSIVSTVPGVRPSRSNSRSAAGLRSEKLLIVAGVWIGQPDHDINQPLSSVIHTGLANIFDATPLAIFQPRTAVAWQLAPKTVLRSGAGLFSDILPGSVVDLVGANPPYSETFQGGLLGTVGGMAMAPGVPNSAIDATVAANQAFTSGFSQGQLSCASPSANPNTCLQPVAITAVPDGKLHAPYFIEWSLGLEHQVGNTINLRTQ